MVSKARLDLPLPLGPVITVIWPRGRSRSIPLRLFWRAPRISTQPLSGGAVMQGFSAVVEPTGDYPIARTRSQIFAGKLRAETLYDFLALVEQMFRHVGLERLEEFTLAFEFFFPFVGLDREEFSHCLARNVDFREIEVFRTRDDADLRFGAAAVAFTAVDDPFQRAHVFTEPGPEKFSVRAFPEPVHVKNQRRIFQARADLEPVPEIISHAVAAEREHRHGIAPDLADRSGRGGGCFRRHSRACIHPRE